MSVALNPTPGTVYSDIEQWIRRIIKAPNSQSISSQTIGDYVNRFYTYEAPTRLQLFELKRQYVFETIANHFIYQFPYQNYQMILPPIYCDGIQIGYYQSNDQFYKVYPELVLNETPIMGDGTTGPFSVSFSRNPILRGFIDDQPYQAFNTVPPVIAPITPPITYSSTLTPYVFITTNDTNGTLMYVVDDGDGNLIQTDATFQNGPNGPGQLPLSAGTVDYVAGTATFSFNNNTVDGENIETQTSPYSAGVPRLCLFFDNIIRLYPVPDRQYKIVIDCYTTPAQFLATNSAVPFGYMAEWIARGAARKILIDNADTEQFNFYEPFFQEQENLVLRRTERQNSNVRTPTIFSAQTGNNPFIYSQY